MRAQQCLEAARREGDQRLRRALLVEGFSLAQKAEVMDSSEFEARLRRRRVAPSES